MRTQYLGLAVGGPADGQRIVHWMRTLVAELKPVMPPLGAALDPAVAAIEMDMTSTRVTYHWTDAGPIALWLPDGMTLDQAVKHMAESIGVAALADRYEQLIARRKDDARHG